VALFAQLRVKGLQSNCVRLCAVRREIEVAPPGSCTRCWVGVLCKYYGKTKSRHRMTGLFTTGCPRSALSSPQTDSSWTPLLISSPGLVVGSSLSIHQASKDPKRPSKMILTSPRLYAVQGPRHWWWKDHVWTTSRPPQKKRKSLSSIGCANYNVSKMFSERSRQKDVFKKVRYN